MKKYPELKYIACHGDILYLTIHHDMKKYPVFKKISRLREISST